MPYSVRAAYYEIEYQEDRDVPFVLSLLHGSVRRVIEIPCGAGRMSRHLAPRVEALQVVDLEPGMVSRAVAIARAAAPKCAVSGHVQDMRSLSLDDCFDLAIIPREGLQLLPPDEGKMTLCALASHVVPGGCILVDLARFCGGDGPRDPDYYKHDQPDGVYTNDWIRSLPDSTRLRRCSAQKNEGQSIVFDLKYVKESEPTETWSSQMRIFRYDCDWIRSSVPTGMHLERLYGGYDRSPPGPGSRRLLALYRKPPYPSQESAS